MTEETVDTQETPAEGVEPTEPTEPVEPTEPTEPEQPAYITAEQMQAALDKQDSSFKTWLGRRDKETFEHIGSVINERMSQKPPETNDEMTTRLLEQPREVIRTELEAWESERTQKHNAHINTAVETVGTMMEADPLYADKDLGNEVVEEIKKMVQTGKVDNKIPAPQAGRILLADALANVVRTRQGIKANPLADNPPGNTSAGLKPPSVPVKKVVVPKLDDVTARMAKKWGYKDEDLAQLYGE